MYRHLIAVFDINTNLTSWNRDSRVGAKPTEPGLSAPSESHISLGECHQRMVVRSSATKAHVALVGGHLVRLVWSATTEPHVTFVDDVVVIIVRDKWRRSPSQIDVDKCLRRPVRPFYVIEQLIACNNIAKGGQLHSTRRHYLSNTWLIFSSDIFVITNTPAAGPITRYYIYTVNHDRYAAGSRNALILFDL